MQKLDQKQKMQVVVLGLLAVGMFGTFIFRMLQVSPAAAHTQTASAAGQQTFWIKDMDVMTKPAQGSCPVP